MNRTTSPSNLDIALKALDLGLSPGPVTQDGLKLPDAGKWKRYQTTPATREEIIRWYRNGRAGNGLFTGYGNLECLEFDDLETYKRFKDTAIVFGLGDLVAGLEAGYCESSPGGGIHWLYRCEKLDGNTKLAERPAPTDDNLDAREPLIETRGIGGWIVIAPSNGRVHPSGGAYTLLSGGLESIVTITPDEREALFSLARSFDEIPPESTPNPWDITVKAKKGDTRAPIAGVCQDGISPGDDFNARANLPDIIEPFGWVKAHVSGGVEYWRRPGKDHGWSATRGKTKGFRVFTSSTSLPVQSLSLFAVYCHLRHKGDWKACVKDIADQGYGTWIDENGQEHQNPRPKHQNGAPGGGFAGFAGSSPQGPPEFTTLPRPIAVDLLPVPALDSRMIPGCFRVWCVDIAERVCCPLEYVAATLIVVVSGLIGRRLTIRPKRHDDWTVVPNLWGAAIGPPGWLKTPAVEEVCRPLKRLVADAIKAHEQATANWEQQQMIAEARRDAAKRELKKAAGKHGASDSELADLARQALEVGDGEPSPVRRYLTNDATVEKLGELLSQNPNGLTVMRDELVGFLRGLDRQGHEQDRAFFLESWNGNGSFTFDRIGRGTLHIPAICLSLFGTIQPGPLARYLRGSISGDEADGLIPRFQLMVYPDPKGKFVNVDRWPDTDAKNAAYSIFHAIDRMDPQAMGCEIDPEGGLPFVRFADDAQDFFDAWRTGLEGRLRSSTLGAVMEAHLAKYRSLMPSLALVFHVVDQIASQSLGPVSRTAAVAAAAWCELLEAHARRIYQSASEGDPEAAILLAERIKQSLPNPFHYRDVAKKGWTGLTTSEDVRRAVGILEDRDWVKVVEIPPTERGGRPGELIYMNPALLSSNEVQA